MPPTETEDQVGTLSVIPDACVFSADHRSGKITVQSSNTQNFPNAIDELGHMNARNLATAYAAKRGMPDPRVNGMNEGPYAVNEDLVSLDKVADERGQPLPPTHPKMQPAFYRTDIPVCSRI